MINCLIVEDEPLAAEVLQDYISQVPFLQLKGVCSDAIFAMDALKKENIDLLFLDIHLPGLNGIDFLPTLVTPPKVILTTAYDKYALQGYEMNVVDYLLKPIEFKRFLQAVNKLETPNLNSSFKETLTVHTDKKKVIVPINTILYIESQKEYIDIHTISETITTKLALSKLETLLDPKLFLRVHRSFIISLRQVMAFNLNHVELPGKMIPIGGNYKELVAQRLNDFF